MAENIIIRQGIEYSLTAKSLPSLATGVEWLAILHNRADNKRFVASTIVESGVTKFVWESGVTYDSATGAFTVNPEAINSTAHMKEGVYELEFISSDLKKGGGMAQRNRKHEVIKSSVMTKNP